MTVSRHIDITAADTPGPRLIGHGLRRDGTPECVCGLSAPEGLSRRALRAWHRDHKGDIATVDFQASRTAERFWAKVEKTPEGCWLWTAALQNGYGAFSTSRTQMRRAHRWLWESINGPVPPGLELDHLCRVRHCVNPAHLEAVTRQTNILRGATLPAANIRKTHCPRGHPYDEENTRWRGNQRHCRTCIRARKKVAYYAQRGQVHAVS